MAIALLVARCALAVVFLVAAVAKGRDVNGTKQTLRDFGLPAFLTTPGAILLPIFELTTAAALLPNATAPFGALAALALLGLFSGAIAFNLLRGRRPDCHCFGSVASGAIGAGTLVRNAVLGGVAGFVIWGGTDRAVTGPSLPAEAWLALAVAIPALVLLGGFVWVASRLMAQNAALMRRIDGLEARLEVAIARPETPSAPAIAAAAAAPYRGLAIGTQAPAFALDSVKGETVTLEKLLAPALPTMLIFADPDCGPCNVLMPDVARWQSEFVNVMTVAVVSRGTRKKNEAKAREHGLERETLLMQKNFEVADLYMAAGTPAAVLVDSDGRIASRVAGGLEDVKAFVERALLGDLDEPVPEEDWTLPVMAEEEPAFNPGIEVGLPAPALSLPDLDGVEVKLNALGRDTLLLFWNPDCGYCQQILPDLKAWEQETWKDKPELLVVSVGSVEENRAQGFASRVVLDEGWSASEAFASAGTPSAVLIDAEGRVASAMAVGTDGVLYLARESQPDTLLRRSRRALLQTGVATLAGAALLQVFGGRGAEAAIGSPCQPGQSVCSPTGSQCVSDKQSATGFSCQCPSGTNLCGTFTQECKPNSNESCGPGCQACPEGEQCIGKKCQCKATDSLGHRDRCGNVCTDLTKDPNCGSCGNNCGGVTAPGALTAECFPQGRQSHCFCPAAQAPTYCKGIGCVNLKTFSDHCGKCGNQCPSNKPTCQDGKCQLCPNGEQFCKRLGTCVTCGTGMVLDKDCNCVCRAKGGKTSSTEATITASCNGRCCPEGQTCRDGTCQEEEEREVQVNVPGGTPWTSTGLTLSVGDNVQVTATGCVNYCSGTCGGAQPQCSASPNGSGEGHCGGPANCGALIGRIAGGAPFFVGTPASFTASVAGAFELGINDIPGLYGDNSGAFQAAVTVTTA